MFRSSKRDFDYESQLAGYTAGGPSGDDDGPRRKRQAGSIRQSLPSRPLSQIKLGYYQQHMEQYGASFKQQMADCRTKDEAIAISCEYLRVVKDTCNLYHRPIGQAVSMGGDDCKQLGVTRDAEEDGLTEYAPTLTLIPETEKIIQVAAGGLHSVFLSDEGQVWTCGANDEGALGREVTEKTLHLVEPIVDFPPWASGRIVQVGAGDNHSIFLTIDGRVLVVGAYKDLDSGMFAIPLPGQLAKNKTKQEKPIEISFQKPVQKIIAGYNTDAAILSNGELYTWGMGHMGELARSESMGAPIKRNEQGEDLPDLGKDFIGKVVTITNTKENGETETEEIYRYDGKLILEKFLTPAPVEFEVPGNYEVLDAAIADIHLLVVARNSKDGVTNVYSAGHNNYGQLGHGDTLQRHKLTLIKALEKEDVVQVAAGSFHSLFRTKDGQVIYGCGRNDYGQLGLFDTKEKESGGFNALPELIPFPADIDSCGFSDVIAGGSNSGAILDNGDYYTWGLNIVAATGHSFKERNESEDIERPTKVNPLRKLKFGDASKTSVVDAAFGGQHGLMLVKFYKD